MDTTSRHNSSPPGKIISDLGTDQIIDSLIYQSTSPVTIAEGPELDYRFANQAYLDLFNCSEEELYGKSMVLVSDQEGVQEIARACHQVFRSGKPARLEEVAIGEERPEYFNFVIHPLQGAEKTTALLIQGTPVTGQVARYKKAEEREHQLQLIADAVPVLIAYVDKDCYYRFNNKAYETWFGHKSDDLYGRHMSEVLGEKAYQKLLPHIEKVLSGQKIHFQTFVKYKDGGDRYINATYIPHLGKNNAVLGFYVEVDDNTEQQQANQALRESKGRFQAAINAMQGVLWTNNPNGEMEGEQLGWEALTGQKFEEYQGFGWARAIHPEDAQPTIDAWHEAVRERKTFMFEHRVFTKDRIWRRFIVKAVPILKVDGSISEWVGVHTDVTEQREAENTIKESEERFRLMADASPVMIWTLDGQGNSTYYNKKALEFTGHTEEELRSGKSWQMAIHPDDIGFAAGVVSKAVSTLQPYQMECRMQRADGEWRWLLNHGMPRLSKYGYLVGYVGSSVDITERKVAEQALKDSEERYQNFIRQSTEGIWRFELRQPLAATASAKDQINHFFEYAYLAECNDAMAQMYGYEHSRDLLNFKLSDFFERNAETEAYFDLFISSGYRLHNAESKELDRYGDFKWFSNSLVGIIENGQILRAWGTQRDITAQKTAEERLAASERYFRELTDTVPAILWITRQDGYCTYLNKNWYEYTGQTPGEAEGFGWLQATHPDDAKEAERMFVEAIANQKPYYILYRLRDKKGNYRWAIDNGQPKFGKDGTFEGMIGTVIDVHEQKIAEDEIKVSESKFRTLAESLPQLVWMTDANGNQEYASQRWKEYTGLDPSGQETWQKMVHPEDFPAIQSTWISSISAGIPYRSEARLRSKSGEYRWHYVQGEPVKDHDGRITKWIGSFTDIHDQKTHTEKLEAIVAERTKELKRSNEDLQQFAHVASHDLKEPVRKIKTFIGRLEHEESSNLSPAGKTFVSKMQTAADRMSTMIDGVLIYSTLNAVDQPIEKVDLYAIIKHIESDLELVIQRKNAHITINNLPVIEGAGVLLYQLFYNLLNNSLKFTRTDGEVRISISGEDIRIDEIDYTEVTVTDNGIGFEQRQAERIFNTFERLHAKDRFDGTGLGLALCKKIAERHEGSIRAEGEPDAGSRFIVRLPKTQTETSI